MKQGKRRVRLPGIFLLILAMLVSVQVPVMAEDGGDVQTLAKEIPIKVGQDVASGEIADRTFTYELRGLDAASNEAMQTLPEDEIRTDGSGTVYTFDIDGWTKAELPMTYATTGYEGMIHFTKPGEYRYELRQTDADEHSDVQNAKDLPVYTIHVYIIRDTNGALALKAVTASTDDSDSKVSEIRFDYVGTPAAKKYILTYESNGGTEYARETYDDGTEVSGTIREKEPVRDGYLFEGWFLDEALTDPLDADEEVVMDRDRTVYAKWKEIELNKDDHWAYIIGYPDGTVRPQENISRAEVATIFFRMLEEESRAAMWMSDNAYTDVNRADWYNNAISTLSHGNIVDGYPEGDFRPDNSITRAEFASIAARFDRTDPDTEDSELTDIEGHWAEKYIKKAEALGYIKGYVDHSFQPDNAITRAEAMTLINRVLDRDTVAVDGLLDDMVKWVDNDDPTQWYYVAVQEATNSHQYQKDPNEKWTQMRENRDWEALEKEDSRPDSSANPGEVMGIRKVIRAIGSFVKHLFGVG